MSAPGAQRGPGNAANFLSFLSLLFLFVFFAAFATPAGAQSYACTDIGGSGGSAQLNLYGICQTVTNYDGHTLCVTTANSSEWSSFVSRPPQNVALAQCGNWSIGGWGGCSASCGGGTQSRSVTCPYPGGCLGGAPGTVQSCNTQPCPINGSCNNGAAWACNSGTPVNGVDAGCGGYRTWQCAGANGGGTDNCAQYTGACPVNGSCNNSVAWACNSGTPVNGVDAGCGGTRTWQCAGANGGGTDNCAQYTGACAPTGCTAPDGYVIPNNSSRLIGYSQSSGQTWAACGIDDCRDAEVYQTCYNGVFSGPASAPYASCTRRAAPGSGCFLSETLITMADGSLKPVSALKPGDRVKGVSQVNTVQQVVTLDYRQAIYGFNGGDAFVTGGHPFRTTDGHGHYTWKAIDPDLTPTEGHNVAVTKLMAGDQIVVQGGGRFKVKSIDAHDMGANTVFNPVMDGDHTYYANGLLVHNKAVCP